MVSAVTKAAAGTAGYTVCTWFTGATPTSTLAGLLVCAKTADRPHGNILLLLQTKAVIFFFYYKQKRHLFLYSVVAKRGDDMTFCSGNQSIHDEIYLFHVICV
jgi:hypothetical protein